MRDTERDYEADLARGLWIEGLSDNGAPIHAEANGWYWYSDADGRGVRDVYGEFAKLTPRQRAARSLRIDEAEIYAAEKNARGGGFEFCPAFADPCPPELTPCDLSPEDCEADHVHEPKRMDRGEFSDFVDSLRPRWAVEGPAIHAANVAREHAEVTERRARKAALTRGIVATSTPRNPTRDELRDMGDDGTFWTVRLSYRNEDGETRRMSTPWHMGSAHTGDPEPADVLRCLIDDAQSIGNPPDSFAGWCRETGNDEDSRSADRTYRALVRLSAAVRRMLGDDFEARAKLAEEV